MVDLSGRDLVLPDTCQIYPASHTTNGGSILFRVKNLTVGAAAQINATGLGFAGGTSNHPSGYGTGGGGALNLRGGGGGYGGRGGNSGSGSLGGTTYGSSNAPVDPGSGGGYDSNGKTAGLAGGGLVRIEASGTLALFGTIVANGIDGSDPGSGSGGGVYLTCAKWLSSSNATIGARGGITSNYGGSGGGGRVAIWRQRDDLTYGSITNNNGTNRIDVAGGPSAVGSAGANGTIVWGLLGAPGTVFAIR